MSKQKFPKIPKIALRKSPDKSKTFKINIFVAKIINATKCLMVYANGYVTVYIFDSNYFRSNGAIKSEITEITKSSKRSFSELSGS